MAIFFAEVLARRLSQVLPVPDIIENNQGAFSKSRLIHDNYKLVKKSAKLLRRKKCPSLLLKLDIPKAFDTVTWQFLLQVLQHKGFGDRWRAWIAMILASSSTSILLNGVPGPKFGMLME